MMGKDKTVKIILRKRYLRVIQVEIAIENSPFMLQPPDGRNFISSEIVVEKLVTETDALGVTTSRWKEISRCNFGEIEVKDV